MKCFKIGIEYLREDGWSNCRVWHCALDETTISILLKYTSLRRSGHWLLLSAFIRTNRTQIKIENVSRGWGNVSVGKSPCSAAIRAWVQILNTHVKTSIGDLDQWTLKTSRAASLVKMTRTVRDHVEKRYRHVAGVLLWPPQAHTLLHAHKHEP